MKKDFTLSQENFDALLGWLSPDREQAGASYEEIRAGLVRFFKFRGCSDPLNLADETINRVALKINDFDSTKNVKITTYFYGFASNVFLEYSRAGKRREISLDEDDQLRNRLPAAIQSSDAQCDCLEKCLNTLSALEKKLVIDYYGSDKSEKFAMRKQLGESLNLKMPALHTKVFRIRAALRDCIEKCLETN